jgi:hypothetical protein
MLYQLALWRLTACILVTKRLAGMEQQHSNRAADDYDDAGWLRHDCYQAT